MRAALLTALAALVAGCQATRPSSLREPIGDAPAVLVKRLRIPSSEPWITRFASHTWFDVRSLSEGDWHRVEIPTPASGMQDQPVSADEVFADERWGRAVEVIAAEAGEGARRLANAVRLRAAVYDGRTYRAWPGPNSNTFVESVLREVDGLSAVLDHNAVGKDWALPGRVGLTGTGYGVELETPLVGVQLGLLEGVELHLLGLTAGIGIYPLALRLPFLPALQLVDRPDLSIGWSPRPEEELR